MRFIIVSFCTALIAYGGIALWSLYQYGNLNYYDLDFHIMAALTAGLLGGLADEYRNEEAV